MTTAHAGRAIRAMREAQDLSLRNLAALAGVSSAYLCQVEHGQRRPSSRWLRYVTKALGEHMAEGAA